MDPGILEHRREPRARLLPRRHCLQEMATLPIPDELVAEIFLRLPTPADLVRASCACVSFYHLIASRTFLRRFRKPLLGFLNGRRDFFPVIPPSPFASAANAVALAADFSFSFLPGPARDWEVRDVRGGRVLLDRGPVANLSLVVCDPLHRQYLLLPPIPQLEGWVPRSVNNQQSFLKEEEEAAEETSFTVISILQCGDKHAAFVFSSSTGQWQAGPWTSGFAFAFFSYLRYAYGCFYGVTESREKLLVLDTRRMEFSFADLPPEARGSPKQGVDIAIVEAGEGIIGMFVVPYNTSDLSYLIRRNNGGSSSQWRLEKTILLDCRWYSFMSSTGRYLLLFHLGSSSIDKGTYALDIKTFQLEKVFAASDIPMSYVYRNFPPSLLSSPTISSAAS